MLAGMVPDVGLGLMWQGIAGPRKWLKRLECEAATMALCRNGPQAVTPDLRQWGL